MQVIKKLIIGFAGTALLASCGAGGEDQGTEYAPNMYHSVAYEPYTQITDKDAGRWLTSIEYKRIHLKQTLRIMLSFTTQTHGIHFA
jgi:hypothetical protein